MAGATALAMDEALRMRLGGQAARDLGGNAWATAIGNMETVLEQARTASA